MHQPFRIGFGTDLVGVSRRVWDRSADTGALAGLARRPRGDMAVHALDFADRLMSHSSGTMNSRSVR